MDSGFRKATISIVRKISPDQFILQRRLSTRRSIERACQTFHILLVSIQGRRIVYPVIPEINQIRALSPSRMVSRSTNKPVSQISLTRQSTTNVQVGRRLVHDLFPDTTPPRTRTSKSRAGASSLGPCALKRNTSPLVRPGYEDLFSKAEEDFTTPNC